MDAAVLDVVLPGAFGALVDALHPAGCAHFAHLADFVHLAALAHLAALSLAWGETATDRTNSGTIDWTQIMQTGKQTVKYYTT